MPIYEYQCEQCGKVDEALQKFSEKPLTKCRYCSGKLHKLISQSAFHLKGTGWDVTDYAGKKSQEKKQDKNGKTAEKTTAAKDTKATAKSAKADAD